jgi:hypothetical protein
MTALPRNRALLLPWRQRVGWRKPGRGRRVQLADFLDYRWQRFTQGQGERRPPARDSPAQSEVDDDYRRDVWCVAEPGDKCG